MTVPSHRTGIIVNHPPGFPVLNDASGKREGGPANPARLRPVKLHGANPSIGANFG